MQFLVAWSRNQKAYVKKALLAQDEATYGFKSDDKVEDAIELGFVDGLFELYKLRCEIETARADIMATKCSLDIVTTLDPFYSTLSFVLDPVQLKI